RLHGMQEVSGSIPLSSTNIQTLAEKRGFLLFVTKFMASDLFFRCVCLPLLCGQYELLLDCFIIRIYLLFMRLI
ncbi:hypothetical protein BRR55_23570, partial [Salmonella enterica]|nr:hypothetical protein [Salmonella enterica]